MRTVPLRRGMLITGEAGAYVGVGGRWEISVPSAQFCCEPKTAIKKIKSHF